MKLKKPSVIAIFVTFLLAVSPPIHIHAMNNSSYDDREETRKKIEEVNKQFEEKLTLVGEIKQKRLFYHGEEFEGSDFYLAGYLEDRDGKKYYNDDIEILVYSNLLSRCNVKNTDLTLLTGLVENVKFTDFDPKTTMIVSGSAIVMKGEGLFKGDVTDIVKIYNSHGKELVVGDIYFDEPFLINDLDIGTYLLDCYIMPNSNMEDYEKYVYDDATSEIVVRVIPQMKITKTKSSITIQKFKGYEYSLDGKKWTTKNKFKRLKRNKKYKVYIRPVLDKKSNDETTVSYRPCVVKKVRTKKR